MGKIIIKTEDEIALMRESSLIVGKTLGEVARFLKPGVTGLQVNQLADTVIRDHGGVPSFKNYGGFPYSICFSVNEQVVHGFPSARELEETDIVSVDVGVLKNGFHGDFAYTFAFSGVSEDTQQLLKVTKESLYIGIEQAVDGKRVEDIGYAIQQWTESRGYGVVRELVGHGLGKNLHEPPNVPNYGRRGNGPKLLAGMTLAIEPMINMGTKDVRTLKDGWTVVTKDGKPSAHFEHDVVVRKDKAEVISTYAFVEEALLMNNCLLNI